MVEGHTVTMARITGIGGTFLRSSDPDALTAWYRDILGLGLAEYGQWEQQAGPTVFAAFPADSDYFPGRSMLNFRVDDLAAFVAELGARGVVTEDVQHMEGVGSFTWVTDPEGNRLELWEPSAAR